VKVLALTTSYPGSADDSAGRAALERLLGDRELRARLSAAAREKAQHEFSFDAATTALLAVYDEGLA
jgi:glycosyltransferase involved in cell wall biosynthesis